MQVRRREAAPGRSRQLKSVDSVSCARCVVASSSRPVRFTVTAGLTCRRRSAAMAVTCAACADVVPARRRRCTVTRPSTWRPTGARSPAPTATGASCAPATCASTCAFTPESGRTAARCAAVHSRARTRCWLTDERTPPGRLCGRVSDVDERLGRTPGWLSIAASVCVCCVIRAVLNVGPVSEMTCTVSSGTYTILTSARLVAYCESVTQLRQCGH